MDDGITTLERSSDRRQIEQIDRDDIDGETGDPARRGSAGTDETSDTVAFPEKCFDSVAADEPCSAGDSDGVHFCCGLL
jgi:hypothetical protein